MGLGKEEEEEGEVCPCMLTSRIIPPSRFVLQGKKFKTAKSMVVHGGLSILVRVNKSLKSHNFMFILRGRGESQNKLFNRKIYSRCVRNTGEISTFVREKLQWKLAKVSSRETLQATHSFSFGRNFTGGTD